MIMYRRVGEEDDEEDDEERLAMPSWYATTVEEDRSQVKR